MDLDLMNVVMFLMMKTAWKVGLMELVLFDKVVDLILMMYSYRIVDCFLVEQNEVFSLQLENAAELLLAVEC